jgi:hypothetical protein
MIIPTDEQLHITKETLEKLLDITNEKEPYAIQFIAALQAVIEQMPDYSEDLKNL